jgi:protein-tyrosine kinase
MTKAVRTPPNTGPAGKRETRASATRDRSRAIGTILVDLGKLTQQQVEHIRQHASEKGVRFGDAAVQLELLSMDDVDRALATQFNYPVLPRGKGGVADDLVAAHSPQCELVEMLRALRGQIYLRWLNTATRRVLAITSPQRGEGRSWLAGNLAILFAQYGERTLLIDADMRNPRQHQLFNIDGSVGLSALLTGRAGREAAQRIHPELRLFVLPAGTPPPNPQELLGRPVFDVVLDRFAEQFDVIVLDTPAMDEAADAQLLAAHAGAALMVARKNRTRHAALTAANDVLEQTGVQIVGGVLSEH